MIKETSRCSGQCCRKFSIMGKSLEELKVYEGKWIEKDKIIDMLIPLGKSNVDSNGTEHEQETDYFTCKHLDVESGDCKIYNDRPKMCRDYPYGNECLYVGCTRKAEPHIPEGKRIE